MIGDTHSIGGWALMEFIVQCRRMTPTLLDSMVDRLSKRQFRVVECVARSGVPEEFLELSTGMPLSECLAQLRRIDVTKVFVNVQGPIVDECADASVMLDLQNSVVVISISESVVFGFQRETANPQFGYFAEFLALCRDVATPFEPLLVTVCSEQYSSVDFRVSGPDKIGLEPYDERFFSEPYLRSIFDDFVRYLRGYA